MGLVLRVDDGVELDGHTIESRIREPRLARVNRTRPSAVAGDARIASPYLTTAEAAVYLRYNGTSAVRTLKMRGLCRRRTRRTR
jgi:hypothetical protein